MRRLLRLLFVFVMGSLTIIFIPGLSTLLSAANNSRLITPLFPIGVVLGGVVFFVGYILWVKDEPLLFWATSVPLSVCLIVIAFTGGIRVLFSALFFEYIKDISMLVIVVFWYGISTRIIKLSREEKLRQKETPSETELRHARERRDPSLDIAERERLNKMLASLPEKERQELLKKQAEYEANQNKE